jgi:hypothetical protein
MFLENSLLTNDEKRPENKNQPEYSDGPLFDKNGIMFNKYQGQPIFGFS